MLAVSWKLHVNKGKSTELYDLDADIGEKTNLLNAYSAVVKQLSESMASFAKNMSENSRPAVFIKKPVLFSNSPLASIIEHPL